MFLINLTASAPKENQLPTENIQSSNQEVLQVLKNFRSAIINNNRDRASELLTDDARILESGSLETKEEYLSHHFAADGKFLKAMERKVVSQKISNTNNSAWISTVSHMEGTYNEHSIKIDSAELVVFIKKNGNWKISAIHWSSRSKNS